MGNVICGSDRSFFLCCLVIADAASFGGGVGGGGFVSEANAGGALKSGCGQRGVDVCALLAVV